MKTNLTVRFIKGLVVAMCAALALTATTPAQTSISNYPPVVHIVNPTNGAVFYAPTNLSLIAQAGVSNGIIVNVEFFAGATDLGRGLPVILDPPGVNRVTGLVYFLYWPNVPTNSYVLTTVATAGSGLATTSAPVNITVLARPPVTAPPLTNRPPTVRIASPPDGAVFRAPVDIPLYAFATAPGGAVASVEFFDNGTSLGFGQQVTNVPSPFPPGPVPPPIIIHAPTNYWELVWTNPPVGTNLAVSALAVDQYGVSTNSPAVTISVQPSPPPPTNKVAVVGIVATDPVAIAGTNCWVWPGLPPPVATWSNWFGTNVTFRLFTNCGPQNATFTVFRDGATNDSVVVAYSIGGTATNGVNYVTLPGSVTIPEGDLSAAITVVPSDQVISNLTSTVVLHLSSATNYTVGRSSAAAAIIVDSQYPHPACGLTPGPTFHLTATGPEGAWFTVQTSPDTIHWTSVCTNQVVDGAIDFVDPNAPTNPALFYRALPITAPPP